MQQSTISPAPFNIFFENLLLKLAKIVNYEDIFAYADNIAILTNSYCHNCGCLNFFTNFMCCKK